MPWPSQEMAIPSRGRIRTPWTSSCSSTTARIFIKTSKPSANRRREPRWADSFTTEAVHDLDQDTRACIGNMQNLIVSAGFYYLYSENPNVQYGTAQYRKTRDNEDRIYGIMPIYNLRVGKSARPHESPNFEELEIEFGETINARCPIMGQSYVHTVKDRPRNTWCITQMSTVPDELMSYSNPYRRCSISANQTGNMTARGDCCPFPELVDLFVDLKVGSVYHTLTLFLDHYVSSKLEYRPGSVRSAVQRDEIRCFPALYEIYGRQNLWVLWLGDIESERAAENNVLKRRHIGLLIGRHQWYKEKAWIDTPFHRYGVCTWLEQTAQIKEKVPWRQVNILLK
ncbi:hypothetical protein F4782DRAFT_202360 [Xylaria castorea]|nr:hypothetical protein F4782DRAFT_202360 [Xylaria castorea]